VRATASQIKMLEAIASQLAVAVENAKLYEQVRHLSLHDALTGLANRNQLRIRLDEEISRSRRHLEPIAVAMVDVDHFKRINDTHGHIIGDVMLNELAGLLREEMRKHDVVARFGGEEFVVIMPDTNMVQAHIAMERVRKRVQDHEFARDNRPQAVFITVSAGMAIGNSEISKDATYLLETADKALYQAKSAGRNRVIG
jgi:diguanylate cyclase (GGDEF)-like protein